MKKIFCFLLLFISVVSLWAAKSTGAVRQWKQPDGTIVSVCLMGDEHVSWYQTTDGVMLCRKGNAFYVAEVNDRGDLLPTNVLAHNAGQRLDGEVTLAKAQKRELFFAAAKRNLSVRSRAIEGYPSNTFSPHTGTVRVPIIMMGYPDVPFTFDRDVFEDYFNGTVRTDYSRETRFDGFSSLAEFFRDASHGKLNLEFDLYGPYVADFNHDYYGKKAGHSFNLLTEAVKKADADIDFTKYDSNGDNRVDMIYILFAGAGANISGDDNDFWPACWYGGNYSTDDNITYNVIGGASELAITAADNDGEAIRAGIGVTAHEMSHGMGLPDLYWTLSSDPQMEYGGKKYPDFNNCGPEDWDIMDGGENLFNAMWPCQYTAWEKDVMGWIDVEELTEPADITIYPLNDDRGKAYRITNPENKYEYYIIERTQFTEWNYYLNRQYGSGLMIHHVNASAGGLSMSPNNEYGRPNVTILPADGFILASYSIEKTIPYKGIVQEITDDMFTLDAKGDPYPGSEGVTSLSAYKNYTKIDGGKDMVERFPITDIRANDDGSISFKFMGGTTAIDAIRDKTTYKEGRIYSLDGQYLGTDPSRLHSGIYIQNGRKFVK